MHHDLGFTPVHVRWKLMPFERNPRAERRKDQVCSPTEYQKVFERVTQMPSTVEHLVVQLGEFSVPLLRAVH